MAISSDLRRPLCAIGLICALMLAVISPLGAEQQGDGSVSGATTSQASTVLLPGVHVLLLDAGHGRAVVAETDSDENGIYRFAAVVSGRYRLRASLAEFQDVVSPTIDVRAGQTARVNLDLPLAPRTET